ncbi:hypothetical protein SAMN05443575_2989 [Jatrophihabitans endophyticus]|uniref:Uncharacterized protein n=1 Tax=Jatrophihabitans endophyticus TaxID=1206085 RepID=A0A1M5P7W3_9ACTN|nr:hypothetical protein [Jatrophihabitans endophyticus]SHG97303.1 hypothetical protein SAMN05443575_2989 [Jatrophihabitans endophyticus]
MVLADAYAPTRAIVGSIVFAGLLGILGIALYRRPGIGWALARVRASKDTIDEIKRRHRAGTERGFRVMGVCLVLAALVITGISVGYAVA